MASKKPWFAKQHPAKKLGLLLGTWKSEVTIPGFPKSFRSTIKFSWIVKDMLMLMKTTGQPGGPPASTAVLGADDINDDLQMLYCDVRGVTRIYKMTLSKNEWRWERKAPGFSQRFVGEISKDGRTIRAELFKAVNGGRMSHDMYWIYERQRRTA